MFWQKLIIVAHYLCIWSSIITIFDQKKDTEIDAFSHTKKGPPFGLYVEKIVNVKFFGNFKPKTKNRPKYDLSILNGSKL